MLEVDAGAKLQDVVRRLRVSDHVRLAEFVGSRQIAVRGVIGANCVGSPGPSSVAARVDSKTSWRPDASDAP